MTIDTHQATLLRASAAFAAYTNAHGYDLCANRLDIARADAEIVWREYQRAPEQYPDFAEALVFTFQQLEQAIKEIDELRQARRAQYEAWRASVRAARIEEAHAIESALRLLLESSDAGIAAWQGLRYALMVAELAIYARAYHPDQCSEYDAESAILALHFHIERAHSASAAMQAERTTPPPAHSSAATAHSETVR